MIMRVLIVDDDRDHAESIADVLAWRGCEVELAFSGEEAVDKFRNASFEFVLMDIKLPGIDGIEVFFECKKIRAQPNILLMTGYSLDYLARRSDRRRSVGRPTKTICDARNIRCGSTDRGPNAECTGAPHGNQGSLNISVCAAETLWGSFASILWNTLGRQHLQNRA
jgi:CheY-like chemotaxis protein